jgi:energy-coupling factor transporter ATP-binding protein EcfA2
MKTWIKSLETSDGYLRDAKIALAEGLTCIIGARGTCKSTIVETLRFVHDLDQARIGALVQSDADPSLVQGLTGLLKTTLASGTALCTIQATDEHGRASELRLERTIGTSPPRIYRDGVLDPLSSIELPIEIYSQGDLVKIAENPQRRLQLVDRPHGREIGLIKERRGEAQEHIARLGGEILALRAALREDGRNLAQLPELEAQLEAVQRERPTLDARLEKERADYEVREQRLASIRAIWGAFSALFSRAQPEPPRAQTVVELSDALEAIGIEPARQLAEDFRGLSDAATQLDLQLADARMQVTRTKGSVQALAAAFEERNQQYRALRHDQDVLSASLEQEDQIRAQMRRMIQLREARDQRQAQLNDKLARREELRRAVDGCLDEIFQLRLGEIEKINADLGGNISLVMVQGAQSGAYAEAIFELLQGTRLKRQREIATRIAELLTPAELIDIIEQEQASRLAQIVCLDESQASRITNHFLDNMVRVLKLETIVFEDRLEITMNVRGEVRPIEQLSRGQMATALLPLILRPAEFPLVFDQPEDDLDNRFIFDELVEKIRKLKQTRQLVFVTHNANIPVLGDADRVIAMQMANARMAAPPAVGTIDEMRKQILDILEGGAIAFRERRRRYKDIV